MKDRHHISMIASQASAMLTMLTVWLTLLCAALAATGELGLARWVALPALVIGALAFRAHRGTLPS